MAVLGAQLEIKIPSGMLLTVDIFNNLNCQNAHTSVTRLSLYPSKIFLLKPVALILFGPLRLHDCI